METWLSEDENNNEVKHIFIFNHQAIYQGRFSAPVDETRKYE